MITERGYVATRQGLECFEKQLYAEALQRGLSEAESVLVLADGAVWIWNLAENRFKDAGPCALSQASSNSGQKFGQHRGTRSGSRKAIASSTRCFPVIVIRLVSR